MINIIKLRRTLNKLPSSNELKGKTYLFVTVRSFSFVMHQELFLANILARNGARVIVLLDDGVLPHWDTYQLHESKVIKNASVTFRNKLVRSLLLLLYHHHAIRVEYTSAIMRIEGADAIDKQLLDRSDELNAISSVRRFFECGYFDKKNREHQAYYRDTIQNIKMMKLFCNYISEHQNLDAVITSHGIYSIWGTAYDYFRSRGRKVYVYGPHAYRNSHTHFTDTLGHTLAKDSSCIEFMTTGVLTVDIRKTVDDYFLSRRNHCTKDTSIYYSWMDKIEHLSINKKDEKTLNYGLFPNIIWDGDVAQRDTIFNGMLDWMTKTINFFIDHPENNLIIRFHPAEATVWKDTAKLSDTIMSRYPLIEAVPNIILIRANQQIDTYTFVRDNIDVGIIYDGILSLELTHMHIPVISPSCNRYTGGSFVLNPKTIEEYYALLEAFPFDGYYTKDKEEEFYKYSYWYLYLSAYLMPPYSNHKFGEIIYDDNTINKIKDAEFSRFYNKLLHL